MTETDRKRLEYTDAGRARLATLQQDLLTRIEAGIRDRKFIPGDATIEVTASDVEELARELQITFNRRSEQRATMRRLTFVVYLATGILTILAALFYEDFLALLREPRRAVLFVMGLAMTLVSFVVRGIFSTRDSERREIERLATIRDELERKLEKRE